MDGARIYAQNAIRQKNLALNYLRLGSRVEAVASRYAQLGPLLFVSDSTVLLLAPYDGNFTRCLPLSRRHRIFGSVLLTVIRARIQCRDRSPYESCHRLDGQHCESDGSEHEGYES
jgi:hypothetical protein